MHTLSIDIETFSSADIAKCGVYKYTEAEDFKILLFAYSFNGAQVRVFDLTRYDKEEAEESRKVFESLTDPNVLKTAWNANFERTCIAKAFNLELPAEQWECTMVKAAMLGLPMSLDAASKAMGISQKKNAAGKALIKYFTQPCKATKVNEGRTRNLPKHDPEKWQSFIEYCRQDVVVEMTIKDEISFFKIPMQEKRLWCLDQKINDTGVIIDIDLVHAAIHCDEESKLELLKEAVELTGLSNPNSPAQIRGWLEDALGQEVKTLRKQDIPVLLENTDDEEVVRVLELRQEMSKTSVKKYEAMRAAVCKDGAVKGLLQFYGANRTGRWAGRLVQVQNLPQNHIPDLEVAREVVKSKDVEAIDLLFGSVSDTLSQLIRTAFVAAPGRRFIVSDFSAIEARIIAWLAGEKWRIDVFKTHGKIYEASAAEMFKVPIDSIDKSSPLRQKGKVSELALGYQGGPNALIKMGALKMGIPEKELPKLVAMWRQSNPAIVQLWYKVEASALQAVETGGRTKMQYGIEFYVKQNILFIKLPSGRELAYQRPKIVDGKFGKPALTYEGMDQITKQWRRQDTYGGKLVENIVQAMARDCLAVAMLRVDKAGYNIVMSVHDEVVIEDKNGFGSLQEVNKIMGISLDWAPGLLLKAAGYETPFYKKD